MFRKISWLKGCSIRLTTSWQRMRLLVWKLIWLLLRGDWLHSFTLWCLNQETIQMSNLGNIELLDNESYSLVLPQHGGSEGQQSHKSAFWLSMHGLAYRRKSLQSHWRKQEMQMLWMEFKRALFFMQTCGLYYKHIFTIISDDHKRRS